MLTIDDKQQIRELLLARDQLINDVKVLKDELYDKGLELGELDGRLDRFDGELIDEVDEELLENAND